MFTCFESLRDPRRSGGNQQHNLMEMVFTALCAIIGGAIPPNEFALRCADSASVAALPPLHQHSEEKTFTQTVLS
ncbi:MAG: hypothetical protein ACK6DN_06530 [Planctomycetota bacterium]|jgi:hypothetical protein